LGWAGALALVCVAAAAGAQSGRETNSYFEFGTVIGLSAHRVEVQTFNQQTRKFEQHSFAIGRESHAEPVRAGEQVEVIYELLGADWTVKRLLVLHDGVPKAGPPAGVDLTASGEAAPSAPRPAVKIPAPVVRSSNQVRAAGTPNAVNLPSNAGAKPVAVVPVPAIVAPRVPTPVVLGVNREAPTAECRQSDPNWSSEPLSLAVLDFRYPTEREEAHDIGKTGGGSGTALADIVFNRLTQQPEYQVDRGDRRRLDRADIAGAAKIGRELGVDAVLEGTFWPEEEPGKGYELRAGLVDTCTGQVLMKLQSVSCPGGGPGGAGGSMVMVPGPTDAPPPKPVVCKHLSVTAEQASEPDAYAGAFAPAIDALLFPLEHNFGSLDKPGTAGVVTGTTNGSVLVKLVPGAGVKVGDQIAVHASRLAKNPTTYTLQSLQDQEIGRLTVQSVQGSVAVGTYQGDIFPKAGDAVDLVTD
jgi:hypothetical protein